MNGPAQEEGGSRGGGSASASALGECGGGCAVERMKEDKTTPPPATPTLWSRRRTAMECLHPPSLLPLPSPPSSLPPAPALPPSSFPFTLPVPYLRCLLRVYRTALANLKLGGVMRLPEWYVLPSSLLRRSSEQCESRAFCFNSNVGPEIFCCSAINFDQ